MSKTLDKTAVVAALSSRLIDLEDYLETEKAFACYNRICLAIDRLDEAIDDAEQAQNDADDEEEDSEDE